MILRFLRMYTEEQIFRQNYTETIDYDH